jgi:hypothetical protein
MRVYTSRLGPRVRASFMRHESPDVTTKCDRRNPEPGQPARCSEQCFVVLPRHPLYGREVVVVSRRRESNISVQCIVVLPENPAFRYRLPERWLESMPPCRPVLLAPVPVRLPLSALDSLTQRLLGLKRAECAYGQPARVGTCPSSDLDSASAAHTAAPDHAALVLAAANRSGSDE